MDNIYALFLVKKYLCFEFFLFNSRADQYLDLIRFEPKTLSVKKKIQGE